MNKDSIKLLIMGKMASGTTEASLYLKEHHNASTWTIADRIKQLSHSLVEKSPDTQILLDGLLTSDVRQIAAKRLLSFSKSYTPEPGKPRHLYQEVGQILRDLNIENQYCWEKDLDFQMSKFSSNFFVVDARATESFDFFKQKGFVTVKIFAQDKVRIERLMLRDGFIPSDNSVLNHESETDIDSLDFDYEIDNSHPSLSLLHQHLDNIVKQQTKK